MKPAVVVFCCAEWLARKAKMANCIVCVSAQRIRVAMHLFPPDTFVIFQQHACVIFSFSFSTVQKMYLTNWHLCIRLAALQQAALRQKFPPTLFIRIQSFKLFWKSTQEKRHLLNLAIQTFDCRNEIFYCLISKQRFSWHFVKVTLANTFL